jgi:hypothetical protein
MYQCNLAHVVYLLGEYPHEFGTLKLAIQQIRPGTKGQEISYSYPSVFPCVIGHPAQKFRISLS